MATRWEVTKAVRASRELPSSSRLIMLTLADVAEVGTAEIPERWTPSVTVLAAETGLNRRTVQVHLGTLEEAGWIRRTYPDQKQQWYGERVRYALLVPSGHEVVVSSHPGGGVDTPGGRSDTTRGGGLNSQGGRSDTTPNQITQINTDLSSSQATEEEEKPKKKRTRKPEPPRADVDEICGHLADWIAKNRGDGTRPNITEEWRRSARLLLDNDGRTVEQVRKAIDWCQQDTFWHSNILSMPTLRKQYEQLRAKAKAGQRGPQRHELPESNAPRLLPASEKCEEHRRPKATCGLCKSDKKGKAA